jgi:hypothetical protein
VEVKDLRKTVAIEKDIRETNAWLEWIKYSILTLNKKDYYACVSGRPETHDVPFPLVWTTNPDALAYMVSLFQDRTAMFNRSCRILSLLFPLFSESERLKPLQSVKTPHAYYTSCLSRSEEKLEFWEMYQGAVKADPLKR